MNIKYCRYCKKYKEDIEFSRPTSIKCCDCIKIKRKNCCQECGLRAIYNYRDKVFGQYCWTHKLPDMINIRYRKCMLCGNQAYFNNVESSIPIFCYMHKKEDMINVKNKICQYKACNNKPSYGLDENKLIYCFIHKTQEMKNYKDGMECQYKGCRRVPIYTIEDMKTPMYCVLHKTQDMINIKICRGDANCLNTPIYGLLGKPREYCFEHIIEGCVKDPYKKCESCDNLAICGIRERQRCYEHSNIDDITLVYRKCVGCNSNRILNYNMKCIKCDYDVWKMSSK